MIDKDLIEKAKKAENAAQLRKIAGENGYDLTEEDAGVYFDSLNGDSPLTDDELDAVSGGSCKSLKGTTTVTVPPRKHRR